MTRKITIEWEEIGDDQTFPNMPDWAYEEENNFKVSVNCLLEEADGAMLVGRWIQWGKENLFSFGDGWYDIEDTGPYGDIVRYIQLDKLKKGDSNGRS